MSVVISVTVCVAIFFSVATMPCLGLSRHCRMPFFGFSTIWDSRP